MCVCVWWRCIQNHASGCPLQHLIRNRSLLQGLTYAILGLYLVILTSGAFEVDWAAAHTDAHWGAVTKVRCGPRGALEWDG